MVFAGKYKEKKNLFFLKEQNLSEGKKGACPQKTLEHYLIKKKDASEIKITEADHGKHPQ